MQVSDDVDFFLRFRHPFREVNGESDALAQMGRCCNQTLSAIIYSYPLGIEATSNERSMNGLRGYYAYAPSTTF